MRRVPLALLLAAAAACLPDNPSDTEDTGTGASTGGTASEPTDGTGGPAGLFACSAPPCTLVVVSQTLDDRVDIYDADAGTLRGRIDLDLKPDPTGKQIEGNLLDEPYELVLTDNDLLISLGHYPDTTKGSILRFPRAGFADLEPGAVFAVDRYFNTASATFTGDVQPLTHNRLEGIFLAPHPSGRVLVGVFANDLKSASSEWANPSELLVFDPADLDPGNLGSFDLGSLDVPCIGGWRLEPLDDAVSKLAVACDGSQSVAVLTLPPDFATASPKDAAAGITGCGYALGGMWVTQFVSGDGDGGLLAIQSNLGESPRLFSISDSCAPLGIPMPPPGDLADIKLLHEPVLVRPAGQTDPIWLVAAAIPGGVVVVKGGASPSLCGRLGGLDLLASTNAPWALAVTPSRSHLAIGAGPPNNPQLGDGDGQVLWGALSAVDLDACDLALTDTVDLNAGLFAQSDPTTWVRAPNVIRVVEIGGDG